jgi:hypothetical protein
MRKLGVLVALPVVGALLAVTPVAAQPTPVITAFCEAALRTDKAVARLEDRRPSQKVRQAVERALSGVESVAPPEIATQLQAVVEAVRGSLQGGPPPFEDPNFASNFNALQEYRYNSCGYRQLDVTGIEYEFQGLPKTVPAGEVAIRFTDNGAEFHELQVLRIKSKDSVKKLAGLSEKELAKKTEEIGGTFAEQGQTSYTIAELSKPGRYVVICHLPVGSTSEEAAEEAGKKHDTKSHAQEGMVQEIKVESSGSTTTTAAS